MALTGLKNTCILLIFFCVFLLLILLYLDKVATDSSHFVAKFHCNAIVSCGEIANKLIEDCLVIFNQNNPYNKNKTLICASLTADMVAILYIIKIKRSSVHH